MNQLPSRGLYFDGVDDYVKVPYNSVLDLTTQLSIEILMYLIYKVTGDWKTGNHGLFAKRICYKLVVEPNGNFIFMFFDTGDNLRGTSWKNIIGFNGWVHLVLTFDKPEVKLYKNGIFLGESTLDYEIRRQADYAMVGKTWDNEPLYGFIILVRVYNRALSAEEIKQCYEDIKERILRRIEETGLIR